MKIVVCGDLIKILDKMNNLHMKVTFVIIHQPIKYGFVDLSKCMFFALLRRKNTNER